MRGSWGGGSYRGNVGGLYRGGYCSAWTSTSACAPVARNAANEPPEESESSMAGRAVEEIGAETSDVSATEREATYKTIAGQ